MPLSSPSEILELQDSESVTFSVLRYETGECEINPKHQEGPKVVPCLRVYLPQSDKAHFPYYYDITSKRLQAQLLPFLQSENTKGRRFKITKHGIAPKAFFSVEVI